MKVLMTLEEALHIKKVNAENKSLSENLKQKLVRLHPTHVNILAGLTESYCNIMKVRQITDHDLIKIRNMHLENWEKTRKSIIDFNEHWGKMTSVEKILENWKDD